MIDFTRIVLPLLLPLGAVADGGLAPVQDPEIPTNPAAAENGGVEGTMMAFGQVEERLTVPVAIGTQGSFPFVIDTGAERTVVSRELAGTLRLTPGPTVTILAMTGSERVGTVIVPELSIESIGQRHTITAPALERRNLGAMGLLGIDTLQDHRVIIDFETEMMTVHPSEKRGRRAAEDEIVVSARSRFGQLIVTDAYMGHSRIQVVLDTGSQVSMGNSAFRRLVGRIRQSDIQRLTLTSVTGDTTNADYAMVPKVRVGDVQFDQLPVAFAEVAPFRRFGLTQRPALLLGMDALRSFRQVEIDFPNRQVRFRLPRGTRRAMF